MNVALSTGVMRSGSTWAYNVLRVLFHMVAERHGFEQHAQYMDPWVLEEFLKAHIEVPGVVAVIKAHYTDTTARVMIREGVVKNVCTVRDPRDCVASRQAFKAESLEYSIRLVRSTFEHAARYDPNTLMVLYDHLMERPAREIGRIAQYVKLKFPDEVYAEMATALSMGEMRKISDTLGQNPKAVKAHDGLVDTVSLIHTRHIQSGAVGRYKRDFDTETAHLVSRELRDQIAWFKGARKALGK